MIDAHHFFDDQTLARLNTIQSKMLWKQITLIYPKELKETLSIPKENYETLRNLEEAWKTLRNPEEP